MSKPLGTLYRVTIRYREPTYEERNGAREMPYRWTYRLFADDEAQARRRALAEFREVTRQSSVGWSREVVAVDVEQAPQPSGEFALRDHRG